MLCDCYSYRAPQLGKAPYIVLVVMVLLCVVVTTANIVTCVKPNWFFYKRTQKKNGKYKQLPVKDESLL